MKFVVCLGVGAVLAGLVGGTIGTMLDSDLAAGAVGVIFGIVSICVYNFWESNSGAR
jgi:CBS-domain-containing membrane protein